jgi:hypothetical protein
LNDFAPDILRRSAVFSRPVNFVSPERGASGLKTSRAVSCQTNFPGIAGENSRYGVFVQRFVESGGTTLRENEIVMADVAGRMPVGNGDVTPSSSASFFEQPRSITERASKLMYVVAFMIVLLTMIVREYLVSFLYIAFFTLICTDDILP